MKLGIVGIGRMGDGMRERLRGAGHEVVGYDRNPDVSDAASLEELVDALPSPRVVWLMVPAGDPTEEMVERVGALLAAGDVVVDGGNSLYKDSIRRGKLLAERGVRFVDAGTSGGIWGLRVGFCLMVGGDPEAIAVIEPALEAIAPEDVDSHVGPSAAGH